MPQKKRKKSDHLKWCETNDTKDLRLKYWPKNNSHQENFQADISITILRKSG